MSNFPSMKELAVTAAVIFGVGSGYAARYFFNERANVRERQEIIDSLQNHEKTIQDYLSPAEKAAYEDLRQKALERHFDYIQRTTPVQYDGNLGF